MTLRKIRRKTLIAAAIGSAVAMMTTSTIANANDDEARYIVKFKEDGISTSKHQRKDKNAKRLAKHQAKMILHLNRSNSVAVKLNKKQLAAMRNDANVDFVEIDPRRYLIDTVTRSFDGVSTQAITPAAESVPYGIALVQADQVSDSTTSNMKVCITDTGYDGNHVDLRHYTDSGVTGDNDDGLGNNTGNWWEPGHSHGTHVAGTIGALGGNGTGVIGVNPSGLLDLHIVKIFNNAGSWGYGSDMVKAVEQCQDAGANVISMSIGGSASSTTEENAFIAAANAGLINIAAAGNDGNTAHSYPASYDSVMSVGALDANKNIASFSQRTNQVEIAAPGVAVNSTIIGNSYASWDGTSMATPHVSAVAALVWSHFPSCTGEDIRQAMTATAEDLGSAGRDNSYGYGLVQAKAMYDGLAANGCGGVTPPPPPPPPVAGILENGVAHTGLSGSTGEQANFTMTVPAGATDISFNMSGGTGDGDLYVRFGAAPTTSTYDCRPYASGNNESCTGSSNGGVYHVMINGYSAYSGVNLVGSYTEAGNPPPPPVEESYTNNDNVNLKDRRTKTSRIDVTGNGDSGMITVDVDIKHTYVGDLKITLVAPSGEKSVLREYTGGSADDILETYSISASGIERNGEWKLQVKDNVRGDTGYIDSWTINF